MTNTSSPSPVGLLRFAALSGALAVAAGAFGAHGASGEAAQWLKTGAHYQLTHALALLLSLSFTNHQLPAKLFAVGSAIFAGSLYAMALGAPRVLGAVTPIGGLALIGGWLSLAWCLSRAPLGRA